jgi:cobaltochelatase CobN
VDVTVRISGFFRDAFPHLISLLDDAFRMAAGLEEPEEMNFVRKHVARELSGGVDVRRATLRIFGSRPGTYGAGLLPLIDARNWRGDEDLAEGYAVGGGYAYGRDLGGVEARRELESNLRRTEVAVKNVDNREHDIFDSDDYMQYHGGMIATVRALTGRNPRQFFGDSSDPSRARVRDLQDEARRVFRSRVVNPKWIESMKRHGYKGAFELSATVDYMFGYDATAQVVEDWMYEDVTESYVLDPETQKFFQESNPWALRSIVERLLEAIERGLWAEPPPEMREKLQELYLDLEAELEARQEGEHP